MEIANKTRCWGKKRINAARLSGFIIASGGIGLTGRSLADDYAQDFRALKVPALLRRATGQDIEDLYADLVGAGHICPMDEDAHRDPAAYLLSALMAERTGPTILMDADPEREFYRSRRSARRISF